MEVEFGKWGNSIALRVPAKIARAGGFLPGKRAELSIKNGVITIAPSKKNSRKDRLARIIASAEAIGVDDEVDWGSDVGGEVVAW